MKQHQTQLPNRQEIEAKKENRKGFICFVEEITMMLESSNCPTSVPWRYNSNTEGEISLVKSLFYNGARSRT